ncbi:uncharacterized protein LOC100879755 [Megachile rotundata]|uniref:uncharacterized protein LOC100879755 n=1 Tax=Megachile rotundata TaxID=143995 RepID=UPI000614DDD9|nr:PREDICTED: uncharacterized protein LOC100879755 [Megachile rotundata]XP_012148272.1 PREDICTED: uncharacterized protein LOC100879755 [Megachile rotundata]
MLYDIKIDRDLKLSRVLYLVLLLICISVQLSMTLSVPVTDYDTTTISTNNSTDDDLYVIKAVVYEIGILTDADNTTNDTTEGQEEVKLSFYNPPNTNNGS